MQDLKSQISQNVIDALHAVFEIEVDSSKIQIQGTRPEFEGTYTFVIFPFIKQIGGNPVEIGNKLGEYLVENCNQIAGFNVVKGFLNLVITDEEWVKQLDQITETKDYGKGADSGKTYMVEFSSPNTNKPLHLGHLRNIFLGDSVSEIMSFAGHNVVRTQIINDRGIHICKSMLAWQEFGNGEEPSQDLKGDKLAGKYYVKYDQWSKKESFALLNEVLHVLKEFNDHKHWMESEVFGLISKLPIWKIFIEQSILNEGDQKKEPKFSDKPFVWFKQLADNLRDKSANIEDQECRNVIDQALVIMDQAMPFLPSYRAQEMLKKWEAGDSEVTDLWKKMNSWVYSGFDATYENLRVGFDKLYYESDTYLIGRDEVLKGLEQGIFFQKEDGSVWVDLTDEGLDQKILLRSDGTSVYMTQDIGTAILRFKDYLSLSGQVYTVGNEQEYHFKVLFLILKKLGFKWAEECYHLSYGMVDLPTGKMKSREGTVVDADDLVQEMIDTAKARTLEKGKIDEFSDKEANELYHKLALGALKYFLLKVDPTRRMLFNPAESIEFQGNTGPFIQYTHARISSLLRKGEELKLSWKSQNNWAEIFGSDVKLDSTVSDLIALLIQFPSVVQDSASSYEPSIVANYVFDLTKTYNRFYDVSNIFKQDNKDVQLFWLSLSWTVSRVIRSSMRLIGVDVPERM